MKHIREAVKEWPQIKELLQGEFTETQWGNLMSLGEGSRFIPGIPNVVIKIDADVNKACVFEKEEHLDENRNIEAVVYTIKNKL